MRQAGKQKKQASGQSEAGEGGEKTSNREEGGDDDNQ